MSGQNNLGAAGKYPHTTSRWLSKLAKLVSCNPASEQEGSCRIRQGSVLGQYLLRRRILSSSARFRRVFVSRRPAGNRGLLPLNRRSPSSLRLPSRHWPKEPPVHQLSIHACAFAAPETTSSTVQGGIPGCLPVVGSNGRDAQYLQNIHTPAGPPAEAAHHDPLELGSQPRVARDDGM